MSLLWMEYDTDFQNLADTVFSCQVTNNPDYFNQISKKTQEIIRRDTRYNIDFLYTAYRLNDDKIMTDYAVWLFQLMVCVLKNQTSGETADYVCAHLDDICQGITQCIRPEIQPALLKLMEQSKEAVRSALLTDPIIGEKHVPVFPHSSYEAQIREYMDSLFQKDTRKTLYLIQQFMNQQIPVSDIYVEILAESMRRIGELWHTSSITVDTEHYCTSVTQLAMSQMYPALFSSARKNRLVLCACPGTELHEMGARMVADLFEQDGWDSLYLGAAVPESAMLEAIRTSRPDLIALSVTMPQHLLDCQSLIGAIRAEFPDSKIAVGGNAFLSTHDIWSKWPVDFYTKDARELLAAANAACENTR